MIGRKPSFFQANFMAINNQHGYCIRVMTTQSTRFEGLDVLRGLAAFYVVLSHYTSYCLRKFGDTPFYVPRETGEYAVWLFFMISGFVIYFTTERSNNWRDFVVSRFTRLYPSYWITLTIAVAGVVLVFRIEPMWWSSYLVNMTMFQEFVGFSNADEVYWSLSVELAFYLIIGILFRAGWLKNIFAVALVWLAICWFGTLFAQYIPEFIRFILNRYFIIMFAPFFLLGIMLYLSRTQGNTGQRMFIIASSLATIGVMHGPLAFAISLALFAAAVFAVSDRGRILVSPVLLWLGAISYSLYLIHRNLGYAALTEMHNRGFPTSIALSLAIISALALATLLTYFIERPLCAYLRKMYRQRNLA